MNVPDSWSSSIGMWSERSLGWKLAGRMFRGRLQELSIFSLCYRYSWSAQCQWHV